MENPDQRPAPLLGGDVELPELDSFMLNTEKLTNSQLVLLSTGDEFKAAVLLWCAAWRERPACSLPNDDRVLAGIARVTPKVWKRIRAGAMRGFVLCSDDRWYHPFLVKDAKRAIEAVQKKRDAANRRWHREKEDRKVKPAIGSVVCGDLLDEDDRAIEASSDDASHMQRTCTAYASHMPVTRRSLVTVSQTFSRISSVETPSPEPRARGWDAGSRRPLGEGRVGWLPLPRGERWGRAETAQTRLLLALMREGLSADDALTLIERASDPHHRDFRNASRRCVEVSFRYRCGWYRPARVRVN